MIKDQLDLFAGRQEAILLFERLCEREAGDPWAFLPILTLVGPAGYGKSLFIHQLYFYYCNTPSLPHISLDFARKDAPHDLLNILGTLRKSLGRRRGARGQALEFPRFDIIYSRLKRSEGQQDDEVDEVEELFSEFSDLIGLAGNIHPVLGVLVFVLKFVFQLPPLRALLRWLVAWAHQRAAMRPQWRWYQDQIDRFVELNLPANASIDQIIRRLNEMCIVGGPEREFLIEQILPKAFLADLRYGIYDNEVSMLKSGPRYVVVFLDSFEALMRNAEPTARQLLQALALNEYRKRGDSDPLLLIVSCEEQLPDMQRDQLNQQFPPESDTDKRSIQERADALYKDWARQLPAPENRQNLELRNLYLPLPLSPLTLDATRDYLLRRDQRNQTTIFANQALIESIHNATQGYPAFLERMATGIQNAAPGVKDVRSWLLSEQGKQIVDHLLELHCIQVEKRAFMLSAIPRALTPEVLRLILEPLHPDPLDARTLNDEWGRYQHRLFLLFSEDEQRIVFVPGIRALFLRKLQIETVASDSDYMSVHQRFHNYFHHRIEENLRKEGTRDRQDVLERSYHALALGNYQPVAQLAVSARQYPHQEPGLWEDLLKVVAQAPTQKLPSAEVKLRASEWLDQAERYIEANRTAYVVIEAAAHAIVLYTWLLANPGSASKQVSELWSSLGKAYQCLQKVDAEVQGDTATSCFHHALELLDPPRLIEPPASSNDPRPPIPGNQPGSGFQEIVQGTYRAVRANRRLQVVLSLAILLALLSPLILRLIPHAVSPSPFPNPFALPSAAQHPGKTSGWIGVAVEPDREFVGLSDGSIPFDYQRPDGILKIRATNQLYQGDQNGVYTTAAQQQAVATLQQAVQSDVNDAEALINLKDLQIRLSGKSCTTFVVVTRILEDSGDGVNDGRDNLQGAYVVQNEYDTTHPDTPICLDIANLGTSSGYEATVAQQIVNAATASHGAIKGLIGWPGLTDSPTSQAAALLLGQAHLPIVSLDSYDEVQFFSNVFHVAPSRQDQGRRAALYAEQTLHKTQAGIITDPEDPYSRDLLEGFIQRFEEDGNQIVAVQTYSSGHTDANTLAAELQSVLAAHPDFIYFTGNADDGNVLLAQLHNDGSPLPLLGSEQFYPFVGFSTDAQPDLNRLAFTSAAYADEPTALHMKELYALDFDSQDPDRVRQYGYSRPDSEAILSYDAMETLITAYTNAAGLQSIQQALAAVRVAGASRPLISFTHLQELVDQHLLVLFINQQEQIGFSLV